MEQAQFRTISSICFKCNNAISSSVASTLSICDSCVKHIGEIIVDLGRFRVKYGTSSMKVAESFLSISSRSEPQRHRGSYLSGSVEYVGEATLSRWPHINLSYSGHHEAHLINYAKTMLLSPSSKFKKVHSIPNVKPVLISDNVLNQQPSTKFSFTRLAAFMGNGILIDLGHRDTRFFAVHKSQTIINTSLGLGGFHLGSFLHKLALQYNRYIDLAGIKCENPRQYIASHIKEVECVAFPNFREDIKQFGIYNWRENMSELCKDRESLMSALPSDIIDTITKMLSMKCRNEIENQGWTFDSEEPTYGQTLQWKYNIGLEKHFVMEALFQPNLMGEQKMGLIEKLKAVISWCENRDDSLEKKILLCGGLVKCSGLVERIEKEMPGYAVRVDEHYFWQKTAEYVNKNQK